MIKESKHPIGRALFVDKSDLAEREKEDLEFVDKLLSSESKLFSSRYEILSVISSSDSHEINDENINNLNNLNLNIKSRLTATTKTNHHHHHSNHHNQHLSHRNHLNSNVHKSHKSNKRQHPYHNHPHHPVVNNIDSTTHLVNDAPSTVTASYLAFIMWQILLQSKRSS